MNNYGMDSENIGNIFGNTRSSRPTRASKKRQTEKAKHILEKVEAGNIKEVIKTMPRWIDKVNCKLIIKVLLIELLKLQTGGEE